MAFEAINFGSTPSPAAKLFMPTHLSKDSMKFESIIEMLKVSQYCINFNKKEDWGYDGCYGYPAAILLLSIVDGIGAHIKGGGDDTKMHFTILNDSEWFNLKLSEKEITTLRKGFRNKLNHELYIDINLVLNKGTFNDKVVETKDDTTILNLVPFFEITKYCVEKMVKKLKLEIIT